TATCRATARRPACRPSARPRPRSRAATAPPTFSRPTRARRMRRTLAALVAALALGATGPAAAQVSLRQDSLPPLPATIRLYGERLPTGADVPAFGPPPGARVVSLDEAVALARVLNARQQVSDLEALRAATDRTRSNAGYG